jgi:CheY-like chemotaxis protein
VKKSEAERLSGAGVEERDPETDLAGALHEVSNALTVVLGWLDAAHARLPSGSDREAIEQALEVARTHARIGYRVARHAIGAKIDALDLGELSAYALARCAVLGVTPSAQRRNVRVELAATAHSRALVRDVGSGLQILTNVLLNAVEFSPAGTAVTLGLREENGRVVFSVSDSGPGIAPDRVANILSTDKAIAPESTRSGGAGLGLRHSAALARARGAELRLVRSNPGACFELEWPVSDVRFAGRSESRSRTSLEGARVLVVEDDAAVCSLIELALGARGAEVLTAPSLTALMRSNSLAQRWSAALVDLSPIAEDVQGSLATLRQAVPGLSVILISGAATGVPEEANGQVAAWVRKPFEMSEVVDVLAAVLGRARGLELAK